MWCEIEGIGGASEEKIFGAVFSYSYWVQGEEKQSRCERRTENENAVTEKEILSKIITILFAFITKSKFAYIQPALQPEVRGSPLTTLQ